MGSSAGIFVLALALVAAGSLHPSQATRAGPSPAPAVAPGPEPPCEVCPPSEAPAPAPEEPAAVTSCVSWFVGMTPCMDFFTDAGVQAPSGTCCRGLQSLVDAAPICLCHAMNGDIDNLMPASTDFSRVADLPATCGVALPVETLSKCETEPVPPLMPPSPAA